MTHLEDSAPRDLVGTDRKIPVCIGSSSSTSSTSTSLPTTPNSPDGISSFFFPLFLTLR